MNSFLVTGGAGFIGSHIVEELVRRKYPVRVLDNFSSGKMTNLKTVSSKIQIIKGDVRSLQTCLKVTRGISCVLHQAALLSVPESLQNPEEYNEVNIGGTLNMLKACVKNKAKRFVFASSSSVYGDVADFPEKETLLPQPISPYALTKLAGEYYCRIFSHHYDLETVCLRYFNVFGPRQSLNNEYAGVVPKFISCCLQDKPAPVYGTGRQSRDFTYVANVAEANLLAATKKELKEKVLNVALGHDISVLGLLAELNVILKKDIKPKFLDSRPGDVFKTQADISRIRKVLGFKSRVGLRQGLGLTVEHFLRNAEWSANL